MFGWLSNKRSLVESGLLMGATDTHSHILYGLDDGVKTVEESLSILKFYEECGLKRLWLTPHTMEDVPNTTEGLKQRFEELKAVYFGRIELHLASEYMMDTLFEQHLADSDLLIHNEEENTVLVETSTWAPPVNLWDILANMIAAGYRPLIAHPERYRYMTEDDYNRLRSMGCLFQLNLPSIIGFYGETAQEKAQKFLDHGWYSMCGSDCHRFRVLKHQYNDKVLKKSTLKQLEALL